MSIGPIGSGSISAMMAGVRTELNSTLLRSSFGAAGILDDPLPQALDQLASAGRDLTRAGVEVMKGEVVGSLVDVLA